MPSGKWRNLLFLSLAELLAMGLWFSASAVIPQLTVEWRLTPGQQSWMTMSVQIGFVVGALISAFLNLADRIENHHLFAASAAAGALVNGAVPLLEPGPDITLFLRFLTGVTLAGVYPPAMKLVATWCKEDRGLGIGILVGAITIGSAFPHLLNAIPIVGAGGTPPWPDVLLATSAMALTASAICLFFVRPGPYFGQSAPFDWRFIGRSWADRPTRLANFGYLGHMWELYAMWAWVPLFLMSAYKLAGWDDRMARFAGFAVIAIGGVGSVLAGILADKLGRTRITSWSLGVSGTCALVVGLCYQTPVVVTVVCLIWGVAIVADSAQFSTAITELTDPRYVGTALTVQTSMGFLLTLFTIRLVPPFVDWIGWEYAFVVLAVGPAFGILSMRALRRLPESEKMASGNR